MIITIVYLEIVYTLNTVAHTACPLKWNFLNLRFVIEVLIDKWRVAKERGEREKEGEGGEIHTRCLWSIDTCHAVHSAFYFIFIGFLFYFRARPCHSSARFPHSLNADNRPCHGNITAPELIEIEKVRSRFWRRYVLYLPIETRVLETT